jgi:hypothetical protein
MEIGGGAELLDPGDSTGEDLIRETNIILYLKEA